MELLKRIPVKYEGELHDVKLVNFSVEKHEVEQLVPKGIKVRDFNGRAMISMVNVMLKNMHPAFVPGQINFSYRNIAFRLLVDDSRMNGGESKGIFFLRSFSDKPLIVFGGNLFTDYNLENANITCIDNMLELRQNEKFVTYALDSNAPVAPNTSLHSVIGSLDRAYSVSGNDVRVVQIQREKWPIEEVECYHFQTNFFSTAKLEGVFRVRDTISYEGLPSKIVSKCE